MSLRDDVKNLHDMILQGQILEAFEKYYADDVVMQEADGEPRVGKDANRAYEEAFVGGLTDFRGAEVKAVAVNEADGVAFTRWWMDFTHKDYGDVESNQVSLQRWEDGKVVRERFFAAE